MVHRLVVEVKNMNEILTLVEFALNLGASVKIELKTEAAQELVKPDENQKEK